MFAMLWVGGRVIVVGAGGAGV
ncbi:hypothetical protein QJS66_11230 [Kocuria rhizophila]|nr:hypothetical protein QJS66_11230 [Kocuria rhizophila]